TKVVQDEGNVFVRYRDRAGREAATSARGSATVPLSALTTDESMTISVPGFTAGAAGPDAASTTGAGTQTPAGQPSVINPASSSTFVFEPPRR
ncbi:MAG: hypothetical protein M3O23_03345, partial [Actinomycetota bacterium]|nr:hypothetical protein [Actinomycetota bacterium]